MRLAVDDAEADLLWRIRRSMHPAMETLGTALIEERLSLVLEFVHLGLEQDRDGLLVSLLLEAPELFCDLR